MILHQLLEKGQAIHARHLDVERQHIRLEGQNLVAGNERIRRRPHDLQVVFGGYGVGEKLAHDRRVVHDQNFDFASVVHRACTNSSHTPRVPLSTSNTRLILVPSSGQPVSCGSISGLESSKRVPFPRRLSNEPQSMLASSQTTSPICASEGDSSSVPRKLS